MNLDSLVNINISILPNEPMRFWFDIDDLYENAFYLVNFLFATPDLGQIS